MSAIPIKWPIPGNTITCPDGNVYTIGRKIGEGNFSVVYSAFDKWDNDLAIKILKPANQMFNAVQAAFEKEKDSLLRFRHPAVTHIYNAFICENLFYLVTERCAYTIGDLLKLPQFSGVGWIKPLAQSLLQAEAEIHKLGYVHRDIHLGNVFTSILRNAYLPQSTESIIRFKLGDFGISRLVQDVSASSTMAKWLFPPEVLAPTRFAPLDMRIDIYHTGLLFLQMLCAKELMFSEEEVCAGKPQQQAREIGGPYSDIIAKALSPNPIDRYKSALEFWSDIKVAV